MGYRNLQKKLGQGRHKDEEDEDEDEEEDGREERKAGDKKKGTQGITRTKVGI